jgi:dihydroneopterin aldolase
VAHSDWIRIRGLEIDCVVGVYPHERDTPQPLELDIELCLDTEAAARRERLRFSVDYAAITAQLAFLLESCRFRMLETAAHALCRYLLLPPAPGEQRAQVARVRLRLAKPAALAWGAVASLEVERDAAWLVLASEPKNYGSADIIHETRDAGIYRLNLAPHSAIPLHEHRVMHESEMVLSKGLWCQGKPVALGTVHRWPQGAAHCYQNPTRRHQTILRVDSPSFLQDDEIAVEGEPATVPSEV